MLAALAFGSAEERNRYFAGIEIRARDIVRAGEVLLDRGFGRAFTPAEDQPFAPDTPAPKVIINLPCSPSQLAAAHATGAVSASNNINENKFP